MNDRAQRIAFLEQFVTTDRAQRMRTVLAERTRYLTVTLEEIYQPHNASAVLRTCDSLGVQDVHIIESRNRYRLNPGVELGSAQWLTLHRYGERDGGTVAAIETLRRRGYRIVATSPHNGPVTLDTFDLERGPAALLFGTELDGLSSAALELADEYLVIPMFGFVESFNISVSAAVILHTLTTQLRRSSIDYHLSEDEQTTLQLDWLRATIRRVELLEREFETQEQA
jgi:tRNA (guanosine-2'-O-)-methyltransferase